MSAVGRNDPCPCGSRFKFKRCCLRKEERPAAYTSAERASAVAKLMRFSARVEVLEVKKRLPERWQREMIAG
jgi:SEC-C motif